MKKFEVGFGDLKIKKSYEKLKNSDEYGLLPFIDRAINDLKRNPRIGIKIPHKLWHKMVGD